MQQPLNPDDLSKVTLAVLAGGAGTRMGFPKANLRLAGKPILAWLLDQIRWPGPTMVVTSPEFKDPPGWKQFDHQAIDPISTLGPLRGILTAIENMPTPIVCVTTVDMPMVRHELLAYLVQTAGIHNYKAGLMFKVRSADLERIEPFPSLFRSTAKSLIQHQMDLGRRSVHGLCDDPIFMTIDPPSKVSPESWTNLNSPADLTRFERSMVSI